MTAAIPVFKPVSQMQLAPGSTVTIPDVSFDIAIMPLEGAIIFQ